MNQIVVPFVFKRLTKFLKLKTTPELVIIGHICYDKIPDGFILGGAAAYSGIFATHLEKRVGIITSVENDFRYQEQFTGAEIHNVRTERNTIFENIYREGQREQHLLQRAINIKAEDIPKHWLNAPLVFVGPIANEVDPKILAMFKKALICVNPQGWMRQWDETGKVFHHFPDDWSFLKAANIVCLSLEDVKGDYEKVESIAAFVNLLILTKGKQGASVYSAGKVKHFPAFPTVEIDPTGAGDIFAIAFLIRYAETEDIETAINFAHAAASLSIEKKGTQGIPDRKAIELRLKPYLRR